MRAGVQVGAEALLGAGADVNAATPHGETPLRIARASEARAVIDVLRRHGARDDHAGRTRCDLIF